MIILCETIEKRVLLALVSRQGMFPPGFSKEGDKREVEKKYSGEIGVMMNKEIKHTRWDSLRKAKVKIKFWKERGYLFLKTAYGK